MGCIGPPRTVRSDTSLRNTYQQTLNGVGWRGTRLIVDKNSKKELDREEFENSLTWYNTSRCRRVLYQNVQVRGYELELLKHVSCQHDLTLENVEIDDLGKGFKSFDRIIIKGTIAINDLDGFEAILDSKIELHTCHMPLKYLKPSFRIKLLRFNDKDVNFSTRHILKLFSMIENIATLKQVKYDTATGAGLYFESKFIFQGGRYMSLTEKVVGDRDYPLLLNNRNPHYRFEICFRADNDGLEKIARFYSRTGNLLWKQEHYANQFVAGLQPLTFSGLREVLTEDN